MQKMIAKAIKGKEFMYSRKSAHLVSQRSAERIRDALNDRGYNLNDGETWHIYDCGPYEKETTGAGYQKFVINRGYLCERYY